MSLDSGGAGEGGKGPCKLLKGHPFPHDREHRIRQKDTHQPLSLSGVDARVRELRRLGKHKGGSRGRGHFVGEYVC